MEFEGRFANKKVMEKFIAQLDGVQEVVEGLALTVGDRADRALRIHRAEGVAKIEVSEGKHTDWYVDLVDKEKGNDVIKSPKDVLKGKTNSAAAIEYGRAGYIDPNTGETYGKSEGLWILHDAAKLPRRGKPLKKVRLRARKESSVRVNRKSKSKRRGKE